MKYVTFTHPGQRKDNEDCYAAFRFKPLSAPLTPNASSGADGYIDALILSDGMGGEAHGADVSRWAVSLLQSELLNKFSDRILVQDRSGEGRAIDSDELLPEVLDRSIEKTNKRVLDRIEGKKWEGSGATIVICVVQGSKFWYSHRGDSRLYHWCKDEQELTQLTMDHTVPQILHDNQMIDAEVAKNHARQNELVFFIGSEEQPGSETMSGTLARGDRLLLCTDGISSELDQNRMEEIFAEDELFEVAEKLPASAYEAGSSDNMTVVLYEYDGSPQCINSRREFQEEPDRRDRIDEANSEKGKSESDGNASQSGSPSAGEGKEGQL